MQFDVEGCGPDRIVEAETAEEAAREAAVWRYGKDGTHTVTIALIGTGPGRALGEYEVRVDGERVGRRIVVLEAQ